MRWLHARSKVAGLACLHITSHRSTRPLNLKPMRLAVSLRALLGVAAVMAGPPVALNLTGCWMMGASNGRPPAPGCGTAPLDKGDGLVHLTQTAGGAVTACVINKQCYRPATGLLTNTSNNVGMLRLRTLTDKGNCSSPALPGMPSDGLLEHFNFLPMFVE